MRNFFPFLQAPQPIPSVVLWGSCPRLTVAGGVNSREWMEAVSEGADAGDG